MTRSPLACGLALAILVSAPVARAEEEEAPPETSSAEEPSEDRAGEEAAPAAPGETVDEAPAPDGAEAPESAPESKGGDDASRSVHGEPEVDGETTAAGRLAPEVVREAVRKRFDALGDCYGAVLRDHPELRVATRSRLRIGPEGRVREVATQIVRTEPPGVAPGVTDPLRSCVEGVIAEVVFPRPEGGEAVVEHPIVFTPESVARLPGQPVVRIVADRPQVTLRAATPSPDAVLCSLPCDRPVDLRAHERIFFGGPGIRDSPTYDMRRARGVLVANVDTGSSALWTAGVVATAAGGAGAGTGLLLIGLGYGDVVESSALRTAGPVTLLAGVLGIAFGVGAMTAGTTNVVWTRDGVEVELAARGAILRF